MKSYLKSYHVFLVNKVLRVVLYLLYPLVAAGCSAFIGVESRMPVLSLTQASIIIVSVELFVDYGVYGGILTKDTNKLEYLKTSARGITLLRKSLLVDKVRRFFTIAVILGVSFAAYHEGANLWQFLGVAFCTLTIIEAVLLLIRSMTMLNWIMFVVMITSLIGTILVAFSFYWAPLFLLWVVLYVVTLAVGKKYFLKKIRASYYDEA